MKKLLNKIPVYLMQAGEAERLYGMPGETMKDKLVLAVMKCFPYSHHISNLDTEKESDAIRFTWRGDVFRVSEGGHTEIAERGCLIGSNIAILAQALIKNALTEMAIHADRELVRS